MPLPKEIEQSLPLFTDSQQELIKTLYDLGQSHLFEKWGTDEISEKMKKHLASQLECLDGEYHNGGLVGYIEHAKKLLEDIHNGVNAYDGFEASVPHGRTFKLGSDLYNEAEANGMKELGSVGFVLVAGGLGERLGYSGIKIGLPVETYTNTCYLEYYVDYIRAVQDRYGEGKKLPLCIMTSGDTNDKTLDLINDKESLKDFKDQISIVQQGQGVPALLDNEARLALDPNDPSRVIVKPHGHGDIHELLYHDGVAKRWRDNGIKWLILFQDTNGLAFHTLPLMLGVSTSYDLIMNSLAVPRKAKQAVGGIAKLKNSKTCEERTINVEYNQLDALLRSTGFDDGDVNDPETGHSPFPGNINNLLFRLDAYCDILERTHGLMPEFVNPKYLDESKTKLKSPTRLECMMQDFPTVLTSEENKHVGFTSVCAELCFSPVKNSLEEGLKAQKLGTAATAATGEADQLAAFRIMMRSIGCHVEEAEEETYLGIKAVPGPAIVLKPDFVLCPGEYKDRFPHPENINISSRSVLIVSGSNVVIERLNLDGAMIVDGHGHGHNGKKLNGNKVNGKKLIINEPELCKNEGWVRVKNESSNDEIVKMRGYSIDKIKTAYR